MDERIYVKIKIDITTKHRDQRHCTRDCRRHGTRDGRRHGARGCRRSARAIRPSDVSYVRRSWHRPGGLLCGQHLPLVASPVDGARRRPASLDRLVLVVLRHAVPQVAGLGDHPQGVEKGVWRLCRAEALSVYRDGRQGSLAQGARSDNCWARWSYRWWGRWWGQRQLGQRQSGQRRSGQRLVGRRRLGQGWLGRLGMVTCI